MYFVKTAYICAAHVMLFSPAVVGFVEVCADCSHVDILSVCLSYFLNQPVNMYPPNSMGFHDIDGNVWEWLEDHINGLPGYKPCYLYEDYSANFFDGLHNMILVSFLFIHRMSKSLSALLNYVGISMGICKLQGGSWISTGALASPFHRSWFRRHFHQHSGFRLVRSSGCTPVRLCKSFVFVPGSGEQSVGK